MTRPCLAANLLLRALLVIVFLPHAVGKLQYAGTFAAKFGLSPTVTYLTALAELLAVAGAAAGAGLLLARMWPRVTWVVTALTTLAIWIVQVGAIAVARWPRWLDYNQGAEYNLTLLAVALAMLLITPWPWRRRRDSRAR